MTDIFNEIFLRVKVATGIKRQKELSDLLDIREASISEAKKRGGFPSEWVVKLSTERGINPAWLLTGIGPMKVDGGGVEGKEESFSMSEMLQATARVLESDTVYRSALASNIRAFDKAVQMEGKMQGIEDEMRLLRQEAERRDAVAAERMDRMEQLILSLGGQVPEKKSLAS